MNEKKPEQELYVHVKKPSELRRNILECSQDVLTSMQNLDKIQQVRKQKVELMNKLKVQVGEINLLASKLAEHLPDYHFAPKDGKQVKLEPKKKTVQKKVQEKKTGSSKSVDVKSALQNVKGKLKKLA
ncbi:hypothetical protein C4573_04700 [Candidatus Woesearchaeota archaeon]|nr:MAG: hypothetical protein C4573_04700 [Candidatus Woesearchaeota archaeon]